MDHQQAAGPYVLHPCVVIRLRLLLGVTTVEEEERERRRPKRSDQLRTAEDGDDDVFHARVVKVAPQGGQCVEAPRVRVDQRRVVPLPARLVFLGADVVVDGDDGAAAGLAYRCREPSMRCWVSRPASTQTSTSGYPPRTSVPCSSRSAVAGSTGYSPGQATGRGTSCSTTATGSGWTCTSTSR